MNEAHLHLAVNHLPIVAVIIGTLVLLIGILLKKEQVKLTGLGIYIFSSFTAIMANATGEGAEEIAEELPGVTEALIHQHEELAESFLLLSIILGIVALGTFFLAWKKHRFSLFGYIFALLLGAGAILSGKMVGTSGGEIRHTEIRSQASQNLPADAESGEMDED